MAEIERADLPLWMQKSLRGTDWGILIVIALSLMAAWPFLLQPGLPVTNASENYVYRTADYAQAISEGRLYPRWSANALSGYGAPIPSYYPPGAAYPSALIDIFLSNDPILAVKLVYVAALCLAGAAVYAFVTRRSGARAGVIAAVLYVYSPYVGLVAPHLLGDLPGVICLMLIPALLWSMDRLLRSNRPLDVLYLTLISAALILTNVPAAIVGWALAAALLASNLGTYPRWYLVLIAGGLGVGLAACFWLPALTEEIQWFARPLTIPETLTLGGLFTPLRLIDPGTLIPMPQFTLGVTVPLFALVSLPVIVRRRAGFHGLFLILCAALIVLALAIFPSEVWLLGAITLCGSIGASAVGLSTWNKRPVFVPVLVIVILTLAIPVWLAPNWSDTPIDTSPSGQVQYEQQGYGIAVLPDGDALPSTLAPDTPANRGLLASYRNTPINKLESDSSAQIGVLEHDTHADRFQVQISEALSLHVLTSAFSGWSARINGAFVALTPGEDGLLSVSIPSATRGELAITLDSTPARTLGWSVAWLALILLVGITVARTRRSMDHSDLLDLLGQAEARLLALVAVVFGVVLVVTATPLALMPVRATPNYAMAGSNTLDDSSDAGLEVLAYRVNEGRYQPGNAIDLTVYWHTLRFLNENYRVRVSLLDLTTGAYRLPSDLREPGGYPTTRWLPRQYVSDPYTISLPADFPIGNYSPALEVCSADCASQDRLTFVTHSGSNYGQVLVLPIVLSVG